MSDDPSSAPVRANLTTGAVTADTDAPLNKPSRKVVSAVWLLIVTANVVVMVGAAGCLCVGMFQRKYDSLVEAALLLNLVTTPAAFLAGLIARDPGQHG